MGMIEGRQSFAAAPLDHIVMRGVDDAPALVLRTNTLSFGDLKARVALLGGWLQQNLPQPGARVASWAGKGELTCLLPLAAARAGLVHIPINPLLKRGQVAHILADSGARMVIGTPERLATLEPDDTPSDCRQITEADALAQAAVAGLQLPPSSASAQDLAAILYTSGSTGRPKGVMLSHANLWLGAQSVATYLGLKPDDRTLAVLPLAFDYGQNQLLSSWYAGACVAPIDYLAPRDVLKTVERHDITTLAGVPPLWVQLSELEWPRAVAARLRRLTNSGGALTPDLVSRLRTIFPQARLFAMYGLTEAFRSTFLDPALIDSHPTSMGKAIPFAEILVVGDDGHETPDGIEGELVHCGPLVAQGYWQDAERTAERFRPAPPMSRYGGQAVWSGDRVKRDSDGLLYFVGRRDAMIKSSGNRISPQEIEEVALASGLCVEAVALGLPDERLGQAVHLVVRALPGTSDGDPELPRVLLQKLPNFMQPKRIHWRETMPLGPNGKIDRQSLFDSILEAPTVPPVVKPNSRPKSDILSPQSVRDDQARPIGTPRAADAAVVLDTLIASWSGLFPGQDIDPDATFTNLGGDSLSYVQAYMDLEESIGTVPDGWHDMSLRDLAAQGGAVSKYTARIESVIALRAFFIILVVAEHANLTGFGDGATSALFVISGYLFGKSQWDAMFARGRATHMLKPIVNLLPLTALFTWAAVVFGLFLDHPVPWANVLLNTDLVNHRAGPGIIRDEGIYWYLHSLIKIIAIVFLLQYFIGSRCKEGRARYVFVLGICLIGFAARLIAPIAFLDDPQDLPRLGLTVFQTAPFAILPLFYLGIFLTMPITNAGKIPAVAGFLVLAMADAYSFGNASSVYMAVIILVLLFLPVMIIPRALNKAVSIVASASFYIYLVHTWADKPWRLVEHGHWAQGGFYAWGMTISGLAAGITFMYFVRWRENSLPRLLRAIRDWICKSDERAARNSL